MSSHVPACNKARTIVSVSQMNFHIFRVDHLPVEEAVGIGDSLILNIGELSMHLSVSLSLSEYIINIWYESPKKYLLEIWR